MPKADPFSPKGIANRQKSKGLQKLRWYCQMCQKQCRDANGFRSHLSTESHQRQMRLFQSHSDQFLNQYSSQFLGDFLRILSTRFGTKRVFANQVYQNYIADKQHVHMNATRWTSLGGLVRFLGRSGICEVDETEKGWYIRYIDRGPGVLQARLDREKKEKAEWSEAERMRRRMKDIADMARQAMEEEIARNPHHDLDDTVFEEQDWGELRREQVEDEDGKIRLKIEIKQPLRHVEHDGNVSKTSQGDNATTKQDQAKRRVNPFKALIQSKDMAMQRWDDRGKGVERHDASPKRKRTAMEDIRIQEEEERRRKQQRQR